MFTAPQSRLDPRHQFPRAERLSDIVISAHIQPGHHTGLISGSRQKNYRYVLHFLNLRAYRKSVSIRQRDIYQPQVKLLLSEQFEGLLLRRRMSNCKSFCAEQAGQVLGDCHVVFY